MPTSKWTSEALSPFLHVTDPEPEALITKILSESSKLEAKTLFSRLIAQVDLPVSEFPEYAQTFFTETRQLPDWADPERILRGQQVFVDHGPYMLLILFYKSLPTLYLVETGAAVLVHTSRLTNTSEKRAIFSRRIAESGQFLIDVMTPQSLQPGGKGIETTQRVRIIHASIRNFLPKERYEDVYGVKPINQLHMAITLMTFSLSMIDGLKKLGINLSKQQEEDFLHAWKVVGYIQGIQEELIPDNVAEGRALLEKILEMEEGKSEAGILLTEALVGFAEDALKGKALDATPSIMIRTMIGNRRAELLGVSTQNGCLARITPGFMKGWFGFIESLEDLGGNQLEIFDEVSMSITHALVGYFNRSKNEKMRIPEMMKERWGLKKQD